MAIMRDWVDRLRARLNREAPGQGLMEYGLIISVVSIAAVVLIIAMGPRVASMFQMAGTSAFPSDRRQKANFAVVDHHQALTRVTRIRIEIWS